MRTEYIWEINVKNTPLIKRKCNHCNCDRFYCSDKFRMNSQKRIIDVWLIYRCIKCDNTYNITILSRTKPELINKELFRKFSENDKTTAWEYAFSSEIERKNNVELDYGSVEYEIENNNLSIEDILNADNEITTFKIKTHCDLNLKLSSVIRLCLGLSANQLNKMVEAGVISISENCFLKKHKVKNSDIILISKEKLKEYMSI